MLAHRSGRAGPVDISAGHCLRCGLMSDAGPSECPPTVRGRRLLGCQSLPRFSFVCSLKILVLEMDLQDKVIGFSSSPPSDRSCGSEDCSRDGNAVAPIKRVFVKSELGNPPPNPCLSRLTHFPQVEYLRVTWCTFHAMGYTQSAPGRKQVGAHPAAPKFREMSRL